MGNVLRSIRQIWEFHCSGNAPNTKGQFAVMIWYSLQKQTTPLCFSHQFVYGIPHPLTS